MPRWIKTLTLTLLPLALAGSAVAGDRPLPGDSWMAASDTLGEMIWPRTRDAVPPRANVRQVRPNEKGVHMTEGSVESLADWLEQFGDVKSGPGPSRR
jgi:hypothetical protein